MPETHALVDELLASYPPATTPRPEFLRARFDAGLAWVHYPLGLGGLGLSRALQPEVDARLAEAGAPDNDPRRNTIGLGMAAPTILAHGTDAQRQRYLRPLWTGDEIWCQLFSEPEAGSDLAGLRTRAQRDGDGWIVNGQKVWSSSAHRARFGILLARTDPDVPKHRGLTYFVADLMAPGVEVRPLRQLTGDAEFTEVFLTDVWIPDTQRLGGVGEGWQVARTTLMNERVAIGGAAIPREGGMIGVLTGRWRDEPAVRTPAAHDALLRLWTRAEAVRLSGERRRQLLAAGAPGPEGSATKLSYASLNQQLTALELELGGEAGLRYDFWHTPESTVDFFERGAGYRYLRAKGNSIEGGTSEILRTIVAERVLGLPAEPRVDTHVAWKDLPKMIPDLRYSDVEEELRASVRALLTDRCAWPAVLARAESDEPVDTKLWRTLAVEMGLAGLAIPEQYGGAGAGFREAAVVLEELGRAVAPLPFLGSAVVATAALLACDAGEQLADLASGARTAALLVPFSAAPGTQLSTVDSTLTGTVTSVADALTADLLLVPTEDGLYAVDAAAAVRTPVVSLDLTRPLCDVTLDHADGVRLATDHSAVDTALTVGAGLIASEQLGVAEWCLASTVDYAKNRRQFGRPIGSFQAVKHRLADVWVDVTQARAVARYAAAYADLPGDPELPVAAALAKAYCSPVAVTAAEECVQLHGGIAFTWEHPAHLYLKRAKSASLAFGTADRHRAALASLVDLPAP